MNVLYLDWETSFPSLSESSGFPTSRLKLYCFFCLSICFHLFQRVVGFRQVNEVQEIVEDATRFPSLSESSGFPTSIQRTFGSRISKWFPSLSESSGFPTYLSVTFTEEKELYEVSISFRE